jgi:hypothetical protein
MLITDKYLEERLDTWARWAAKGVSAIGYPSTSPEYRILIEGVAPGSGGKKSMPSHPDAEEMDAFVSELREYFLEKAEIIKSFYLHKSATSKMNDLIAKHNLPYREFYRELKVAKDMLRLLMNLKSKEQNKIKSFRKAA